MATKASAIAARFYRTKKKKRKSPKWTNMGDLRAQVHELVLGVCEVVLQEYFNG